MANQLQFSFAYRHACSPTLASTDHRLALFIAIFVGIVTFAAIVGFVYAWVRARGIFIFTDCIVRNRTAIKEPWREYRREGNSYFLFFLAVFGITLLVIAILGGLFIILATTMTLPRNVRVGTWIAVGVLCFVVYISVIIVLSLISYFMPMVMYRRRCRAWEAFHVVAGLMWQDPGSFLLFCLFGILLFLGWIMVAGMVTCATCCMAMLPYVGSVLLLPVFVWFRSFGLLFFRQFGTEYDVWASVEQAAAEPIPPAAVPPPPIQ